MVTNEEKSSSITQIQVIFINKPSLKLLYINSIWNSNRKKKGKEPR